MNKQLEISVLIDEIKNLLSNYHCHVSAEMKLQKMYLSNSSELLAPIHNQSYHIFDLNEGLFCSTHSIFEKKLFKTALYAHQPLDYALLNELIQPDDQLFSFRFVLAALQFLLQLPAKRAKEFSACYSIRLKNKAGKFEYFCIRFKVLLCNDKGNPWLVMMHCKYSPFELSAAKILHPVIWAEPFDLIRKSKIFDRNEFTYFTKREIEVAEEVNKGLEKVYIADNLNISPETIKTHFRNIVKKSGLNNIHHVCLQISRMGIIPALIAFILFIGNDLLLLDCLLA